MEIPATQRRALRAKAHHLEPVVSIGKDGLTPAVQHEIDLALLAHELIKVRVGNDQRDERAAMLSAVCDALACAPVQHVGKILVLWRFNPDKQAVKDMTGTAKAKPAKGGTGAKSRTKGSVSEQRAKDVRAKERAQGMAGVRTPAAGSRDRTTARTKDRAGDAAGAERPRGVARLKAGAGADKRVRTSGGKPPAGRKPAPSTQGVPYFSRRGAGRFVAATTDAPPAAPVTRRRTRT